MKDCALKINGKTYDVIFENPQLPIEEACEKCALVNDCKFINDGCICSKTFGIENGHFELHDDSKDIVNLGWHKCVDSIPQHDYDGYDWVLIKIADHIGVLDLPHIAEYSKITKKWHNQLGGDFIGDFKVVELRPIETDFLVTAWIKQTFPKEEQDRILKSLENYINEQV